MYHKAYGIIETLAPLHIGASAGEEAGNLNMIFRDQFTQTGIIPGSSIRGRFRADMRNRLDNGGELANLWYGRAAGENNESTDSPADATPMLSESLVKFEYASVLWLPVFCPGQPIVWVSCPRWLKRYKQLANLPHQVPNPNTAQITPHRDRLFFNLGFLDGLTPKDDLKGNWMPKGLTDPPDSLVIVEDKDIGLIHDMALYRQTRTKLQDTQKIVDNFFGFEALPEAAVLLFPIAIRQQIPATTQKKLDEFNSTTWQPFGEQQDRELYLGGLESVGCGRCRIQLSGKYFDQEQTP
ncbi:MAG: type III-B CRISPR module RAMP protein Cmr4 [Acaryochloris sp. SU_5_25]|nr:type III-B CRISPR module RAMP protein Cmr4 [Acaryochloris sp. SU_5_25]